MPSPLPTLSPTQERQLLTSILSGSASLPDLAASLNLTLLDLLELIASPEIQARLVAAEQAAAHALRARASQHLDTVLDTLTEVLDSHRRDFEALKSRTDPEAIALRRAERPHIRRAATTVLRLTRFSPLAPNAILTARPAPPSQGGASPRGGALWAPRNLSAHSSPDTPTAPLPSAHSPTPLGESRSSAVRAACSTPSPALVPSPAQINTPAASPRPQPERLNASSRKLSNSSTAAGELRTPSAPRPERVLVPPAAERATLSRAASLFHRAGAAPSTSARPPPDPRPLTPDP